MHRVSCVAQVFDVSNNPGLEPLPEEVMALHRQVKKWRKSKRDKFLTEAVIEVAEGIAQGASVDVSPEGGSPAVPRPRLPPVLPKLPS